MSIVVAWLIVVACALALTVGITLLIDPHWAPSDTLRWLRDRLSR